MPVGCSHPSWVIDGSSISLVFFTTYPFRPTRLAEVLDDFLLRLEVGVSTYSLTVSFCRVVHQVSAAFS